MYDKLLEALSKEIFWGPFLVLAGIFTLIYPIVVTRIENLVAIYTFIAVGIFLLATGVYFMLKQLSHGAPVSIVITGIQARIASECRLYC